MIYTPDRIAEILKEHEDGMTAKAVAKKHGVSVPTIYRWKAVQAKRPEPNPGPGPGPGLTGQSIPEDGLSSKPAVETSEQAWAARFPKLDAALCHDENVKLRRLLAKALLRIALLEDEADQD